jgi:hypothetical protein
MSTDAKTPEQAARFVRDCLYLGPVYQKLYALRRQRPELAYELDELAVALKQTGDRIETFVRAQAEGADGRDSGSPRADHTEDHAEDRAEDHAAAGVTTRDRRAATP